MVHFCAAPTARNLPALDIEQWEKYGRLDADRTERALLRHTLNHLIQLVDEDDDLWFPEEFYLCPPPDEKIRTGSLLQEKEGSRRFAVLNPSCDLVIRAKGRNTDRALLAEVVSPQMILDWYDPATLKSQNKERRNNFSDLLKNKGAAHYHCLPETKFYSLGFLNFRYLSSPTFKQVCEKFVTPPRVQISPVFTKDIVARFSSYYARQGQPELDFKALLGS